VSQLPSKPSEGLCVIKFDQIKAHKSKQETRVVKINTVKPEEVSKPQKTHTKPIRAGSGRLGPMKGSKKTTEPTVRGRARDTGDASLISSPSVGKSRREKLSVAEKRPKRGLVMVPVLSSTGKPLMPCHPARAKELIKKGRAVKRWFKGIFCIKLLDRAEGDVQQVVVGIDPGSKREGFTVQSKSHTYLNVLSDAITWVKRKMETRKVMCKTRRHRKTPYRKNKCNRQRNAKVFPPSTKSRWLIKLNITKFLRKIYPITDYVVEDVKAKSKKGCNKWNKYFSPVEFGKTWFYKEISKLGNFITKSGKKTFDRRNLLGLKKSGNKLSEKFEAHNVDSWVLASFFTGRTVIDNKIIFRIIPLQLRRRELHYLQPSKGGKRGIHGGTISLEFKRGSVVKHSKKGLVYIGGTTNGKVSLHNIKTGKRLTQNGEIKDIEFLYNSSWITKFVI